MSRFCTLDLLDNENFSQCFVTTRGRKTTSKKQYERVEHKSCDMSLRNDLKCVKYISAPRNVLAKSRSALVTSSLNYDILSEIVQLKQMKE